jgi:hypothetical protein
MGSKIMHLLIFGMVCFLLLMAYVIWQSYEGRVDLVNAQRAACARGKLDRRDNAKGWRTAEKARLATLAEAQNVSYNTVKDLVVLDPKPDDPPDLVAARRYDHISASLESRSRITCTEAFPDASLIP